MLFLSPGIVEGNSRLLAAAVGVREGPSRAADYAEALETTQHWRRCLPPNSEPGSGLTLVFPQPTADACASGELFAHFLNGYNVPSITPFHPSEEEAIRAAVTGSLDLLARLNPDARATFDFVVRTLLLVRIPAFGSLSDALSIVMAGPDPAWPPLELAELLWHEAVHQTLFLEEFIQPLFVPNDTISNGACVRNPLLGMDRPFDLAFHGAAVSAALMDLHYRAGSRQRASELLEAVTPVVERFTACRHLLTARGSEILNQMITALLEFAPAIAELPASSSQRLEPLRQSYLDLPPHWRERA